MFKTIFMGAAAVCGAQAGQVLPPQPLAAPLPSSPYALGNFSGNSSFAPTPLSYHPPTSQPTAVDTDFTFGKFEGAVFGGVAGVAVLICLCCFSCECTCRPRRRIQNAPVMSPVAPRYHDLMSDGPIPPLV